MPRGALLLLLAAAGALRLPRTPRPSSRAPLLALRGGAADETLPLPSPPPEEAEEALPLPAAPSEATLLSKCAAALRLAWRTLCDWLSPTYDYAKKDSDLLGDARQTAGFAADDESWRTQRKKIHDVELQPAARKRVLRDLRRLKQAFAQDPLLGIEVEDCEVITDWVVKITGAKGTVYEGEIYRIRVRFHPDYPTAPPEVTFMRPAPVHEHIYSDGKICLNILYSDWDPKMDVKSVCLSLLSMLSSAKKKSRPPDNDSTVVMSQGQKTRNMQWEFHDDNC
ncbi:hypothetical protein AB1Y20_008825 [Prymnesium parvum]|uniref:UBC core domain-containing protein n=1 Tax=Prymnesium parvum TaxID=97485 RepID=A0AB34ISK5_PRYPA